MPFSNRSIRRLIPAVPALSRVKVLMWPLDLLDRLLCWPYREFRALPPNHLRIRVGVGNRILFNAAQFRLMPINFWLDAIAAGRVTPDSRIVDLGCGCGRYAMPIRDFLFHDRAFTGTYFGVDVDDEMLAWCRTHFARDHFQFHKVEVYSRTYNPDASVSQISPTDASAVRLPLPSDSQDFIFGNSLFSHLLESDFASYIREGARLLRAGGTMQFSVFCLEHVNRASGSRWSFRHRSGAAFIENEKYPEAAVAYEQSWIERTCREAGFGAIELLPSEVQTMVIARRAPVSARPITQSVELKPQREASLADRASS